MLNPPHPGELLHDDVLPALGLSVPYAESLAEDAKAEADFVEAFYKTVTPAGEHHGIGFDINGWAKITDVAPLAAARILLGQNPTGGQHSNARDLQLLAALFEGEAKTAPMHRTLMDWVALARERKVTHDEDIARAIQVFARAVGKETEGQAMPISPDVVTKNGTQPALSKEQKAEIVALYQCKRVASISQLATRFNVSRRTIDKALSDAGVRQTTPRKGRSTSAKTARRTA